MSERKMILEMLQEGTITVDEAERLLSAVPADEGPATATEEGPKKVMPKRLTILVNDNDSEKPKVNVKIPFSLVRIGLKLGQSFGAIGNKIEKGSEEAAKAFELLKSIDIDELMENLDNEEITLPYHMVDVDDEDKGEKVKIVLE